MRFPTEPPAASIRSMGSASLDSIFRGPVSLAAPSGPAAPASVALSAACGALAGGVATPPLSTSFWRLSANWPSNLLDTSAMTPRPNCATLPVMLRSVSMLTVVLVPSGTRVAVTVADALPCPRVSRPLAEMTARCADSSTSVKRAVPLYCAVIGPTFTFTTPRYSSPSTSCNCAPGMQGAMRSTSVSTLHAVVGGTATRKSFVSSIARGPPRCRCRPVGRCTVPR